MDPLAEDYASLSMYNYTANNPIRFIDPDGRKIGKGKKHFNRFKKEVDKKMKAIEKTIAKREAKLAKYKKNNKSKRKIGKAQKRLDRAKSTKASLMEVNTELDALEGSDQVYNLITFSEDVSETASGNIQYDTNTGEVNVNVKGFYNTIVFAHELKHAYQFETGSISFGVTGKGGGILYDLQDEYEAYARGAIFGGFLKNIKQLQNMSSYKDISDRVTQRSLITPYRPFVGSSTYGEIMEIQNNQDEKNKEPIRHNYKDYKND